MYLCLKYVYGDNYMQLCGYYSKTKVRQTVTELLLVAPWSHLCQMQVRIIIAFCTR